MLLCAVLLGVFILLRGELSLRLELFHLLSFLFIQESVLFLRSLLRLLQLKGTSIKEMKN